MLRRFNKSAVGNFGGMHSNDIVCYQKQGTQEVDIFTTEKRRKIMQAVRRKATAPELKLTDMLTAAGLGFQSNVAELPGKPDVVLPQAMLVVFVHGCFWHGHARCRKGRRLVKSHRRYWRDKIARNQRRDRRVATALRDLGYAVLTIWGCKITPGEIGRIRRFAASRIMQGKCDGKGQPTEV